MSASLIRRGLELLSDDIKVTKKVNKKKQHTPSSAMVMDPVRTKRQRVTKQGRVGPCNGKASVKDKRIKSAVEECRRKQRKSHMSASLQYFMEASCKATDSDTLKILRHNSGRPSQNHLDQHAKKAKEPQSLFTEEEFQQFQREYFGRTVEKKK